MKNLILASLAIILCCVSCSAAPQTKNLDVKSTFKELSVKSNIEVTYTVASKVEVKVVAEAGVIDNVIATVAGNILTLDYKGKNTDSKIKVYLKAPALQSITVSQNAGVKCDQHLIIGEMALKAFDNGEIKARSVTADNAVIEARANAEIKVGDITCTNIVLNAGANSEISCKRLSSNNIIINASDNAEITAKDLGSVVITASSSANAEINLKGHASMVTFTATATSEINAADLTVNSGTATAGDNATIRCHVIDLTKNVQGMGRIKNR